MRAGAQGGIQRERVARSGEHVGGPGGVFVLPLAAHVERQPDPLARQEPGPSQKSGSERVERTGGFDLTAAPARDADSLGAGLHRDRPVVGERRRTVGV